MRGRQRPKLPARYRAEAYSPEMRLPPPPRRSMMSDYAVSLVDDNVNDFYLIFEGPKDSARPRAGQRAAATTCWLRRDDLRSLTR